MCHTKCILPTQRGLTYLEGCHYWKSSIQCYGMSCVIGDAIMSQHVVPMSTMTTIMTSHDDVQSAPTCVPPRIWTTCWRHLAKRVHISAWMQLAVTRLCSRYRNPSLIMDACKCSCTLVWLVNTIRCYVLRHYSQFHHWLPARRVMRLLCCFFAQFAGHLSTRCS